MSNSQTEAERQREKGYWKEEEKSKLVNHLMLASIQLPPHPPPFHLLPQLNPSFPRTTLEVKRLSLMFVHFWGWFLFLLIFLLMPQANQSLFYHQDHK